MTTLKVLVGAIVGIAVANIVLLLLRYVFGVSFILLETIE